jgi:hypothetical protein
MLTYLSSTDQFGLRIAKSINFNQLDYLYLREDQLL